MAQPSEPRTQLSVSQRQTLSAGLTYSLGILSLNTVDLARRIAEEAAENPLLRVRGDSRVFLSEHLRRQLMENNPAGRRRDIAQYLIGDLTDEGYPGSPLSVFAEEMRRSEAEVEMAL